MFLSTGLLLNELAELTLSDIHWDQRLLIVPGKRKREIPLTDEGFNALALWSKERIDTPQTKAFFLRTKGKPTGLTSRGIDDLIRKCGIKSGLPKTINAHILRNTFAIRLFQTIPKKEAALQLGITDSESIARYLPIEEKKAPIQALASSSKLTQWKEKLFPIQPKIVDESKNPIETIHEADLILGRDHLIRDLKAALNKGQSTLITSTFGTGKSHLLKHIAKLYGEHAIYFAEPTPIKPILLKLITQFPNDGKDYKRLNTQELLQEIIQKKPLSPPILVIDNLHKLKITDVNTFLTLLANYPILGSTDELTDRLKTLWWKFQTIELQPLREAHSKELIKKLTANMAISDYEFLETRILQLANGLPLAIVDMINQLRYKNVVNPEVIRNIYHEAGTKYRDWTPAIIIFWAGLILLRFVALGTHSFEGYILVGFGTSFFIVVKYFMGRFK